MDPQCFRYGGLCSNPAYKAIMQKNCAVTCARQIGSIPPAPCVDRNAYCPTWPNFCQNSYYTAAQKKYYCQKTCNMC
ncbi:Metridin-like ShK toxin [Aphelenchoides avenae]|nr:Metridin-like ShK toxin [Aphelenchus avenae]